MSRAMVRVVSVSLVVLASLAAWSSSAAAQAPGLPRGYDVQRVDSPSAGPSDTFGFGIINGGDLNADGIDDLLSAQGTRILNDGTGAENGELLVISGADGSVIRTISAPEPETAGGAGLTENRSAAFGFYIGSIGRNAATPPFTDLSSCPGGSTDADPFCDAAAVGPPDGVPDIVASALFVDRASPAATDGVAEDIGRVYVIDGATFTVVKRLDMPQADVDDLADETERLVPASPASRARPWFGRTVLNPMGQAPCAGNYGVGPCDPIPDAVRRGDLTGGGRPDIVVGASAYKYEEAEGTNPACNDTTAVDTCIRSGRAYMYRGEDIVGTDPAATLSAPAWNIVNPYAQADDPGTRIVNQLELFGHSVAPVGDVGSCGSAPTALGFCPAASVVATPDGRPDVLISAFRVDYPTSGPDNEERFDIGVNLMLDGATGAVLQTYHHPDPDPGSIFGFTIYNQPPIGNGGFNAISDVYIPAAGQDTDRYRGEGIGFLMNGAAVVSGNTIDLQRFRSPNPAAGRSFGTTAAGVGNVFGDPTENEILIGEFSTHNPPQNDEVVGEVSFFDAVTGNPLQTIADPDQQKVSNFGVGVAPLGEINGDGFLDFAVGAGRFDRAGVLDVGRVYIFRSNNAPAPVTPAPPPAGPAPAAPTQLVPLAGRALELVATPSRVRRGRTIRLAGTLEAFANAAACQVGHVVEIQRRTTGTSRYATVARVRTDAAGAFSATARATRTSFFRARIGQDASCLGTVSPRERVDVTPSVRLVTRTARLSRSGIRLQVDCRTEAGPCNGTLKLRTITPLRGRRRTLPTASFQTPGDERRSVTVRVGPRTRTLLRRAASVRARAFILGRDRDGNSTTITARLAIRTR
ncbi:MAG TPA: integrin alpha [Solirubrobacteraceae bacterium]|nr:integrin alpha [Solirubrobacteraceae bacterium]